jgi:hypothetical protein
MRRQRLLLAAVVASLSGSLGPSIAIAASADQTAIIAFAQNAAVRALDFNQADLPSLMDARDDFTPAGWTEFIAHMDGYLDEYGAPQFNQNFVGAGDAVLKASRDAGAEHVVSLAMPGTLKQTTTLKYKSSATYRVRVDVVVGGTPPKIEHLKPIICGGEAAKTYCMTGMPPVH